MTDGYGVDILLGLFWTAYFTGAVFLFVSVLRAFDDFDDKLHDYGAGVVWFCSMGLIALLFQWVIGGGISLYYLHQFFQVAQ